jgi:hypothetical protein
MSTLNLFPARVPIGVVQPDGTVLMTAEFVRAMSALSARLGGPEGLGTDDLAILASSVAQAVSSQSQAIEDIGAVTSPDLSGQVAALLAEVQELRSQANQFVQLQAEIGELRKELAGLSMTTYEQPLRADLAEVRKELEGVQMLATFQDPYRVDLTRPGPIGSGAPSTGAFTTISATGQITSTVATGTAPFSIASTTVVPNLNVSQLLGGTWAIPSAIGSTTPSTGAFTTLSATGQITSTVSTGTAPLVIASTTAVANLNASLLLGSTWASPAAIGTGTPAAGTFTALTAKVDQTSATSITVSNAGTAGATTIMQFELAESIGSSRGWFRRYRDGSGLTEIGFSADLNFLGGVGGSTASLMLLKSSGSLLVGTTTDGMTAGGSLAVAQDFAHRGSNLGFYNTAPAAKQTVTGSRGGNAALASLLTALATTGMLTDSSTA